MTQISSHASGLIKFTGVSGRLFQVDYCYPTCYYPTVSYEEDPNNPMMFQFLKPDWVVLDVLNLPLDALAAQGVKGFIFDLDNTIMPPHTALVSDTIKQWLASLTTRGFSYIVVSNNHNVAYMQQAENHLGVPVLGPARKPSRTMLREALTQLSLPTHQVCVVGDRPLTDIWGGQRLGATTILVDPLQRAIEKGHIHVLRALERLFIQVPPHHRCIGYTTPPHTTTATTEET